jgi:hypothetical protein
VELILTKVNNPLVFPQVKLLHMKHLVRWFALCDLARTTTRAL